jgi:PAS domain S-box-containing protein
MQCSFRHISNFNSVTKHSVHYWLSALLLVILAIFSLVFLFSNYYLQAMHAHQNHIDEGIEESKLFSMHLNKEIEKQQSVIRYLAQDTDLLNAIAFDNEFAISKWISTIHKFKIPQTYFVQSLKTNKIFSYGSPSTDVKKILHRSSTSPNFIIYKDAIGQYLLCITHALRLEGSIVGILGSTISLNSFTTSVEFDKESYSILILEHGEFTDVLTGKKPKESVTMLQDALHCMPLTALATHKHLAIPIGINNLYLYAHTSSLTPNLSNALLVWLLISLAGCVIAYFIILQAARHGIRSLLQLTAFTGDKKKDRTNMQALADSTSIAEISNGARSLVKYCDILIKSEEYKRHTALFEACTTAIIVCDLEGRIIEWNDELLTLLGGTQKNFFGLPVKELFGSVDQLKVITGMAHVRQAANNKQATDNIFSARLRLNSFRKRSQHVETVIKYIQYTNQPSLVLMLYNITKHVLAERGLQQAKNSAELMTKERHQLYMGLTQEFEPLAEALNQSLILLSETQPSSIQQRHMEQLQFQTELLSEHITSMRNFALLETGGILFERSMFDIETLLQQVHASTYSRAMQMQSDICIYLDPAVPQKIWFDFSKSLQVLSNLINLAGKKVHGGTIVLTVTAGEVLNSRMQILFEVCAQKKINDHTSESAELGTLPQPEYYGEKGQQLSLAIIERMIQMFPIELLQNVSSRDVHVFGLKVNLTPQYPVRDNLHTILEGRTILLSYCEHNTINFIGKTLSRLGATCTFSPITDNSCQEVIEGQNTYDAIISCGCAFEIIPKETLDLHCKLLTTAIYTVTHSYWEPTYLDPNIICLRKPVMVNELLSRLCGKLLPTVSTYTPVGESLTAGMVLIIAKISGQSSTLQHHLHMQGYITAQVEDVSKGVDARQLYQPEIILLDTGSIALDSYWLIKNLRDMEEAEQLTPSRIIMFINQEHARHTEYIDPYTLTLDASTSPEDLISHMTILKEHADNAQVA